MFIVKKLEDSEFEKIAAHYPDLYIPIEQSPAWGGYEQEMGGRKILGTYAFYQGEQLICTTRLNYFELSMRNQLQSVKGPVWYTEATPELEQELIDTMKQYFSKEEKLPVTFLRMWIKFPSKDTVLPYEDFLADREIWVELDKEPEEFLQSFGKSARRYIRKSMKMDNLEIKEITDKQEAVAMFDGALMDIMDETRDRNNFLAHPREVYQATLRGMPDQARLFVVYVDGEPVTWTITTEYHHFSTYLFSAGNAKAREVKASYITQYTIMNQMRERGIKYYNLTGIESENYPGLKGVTEFKQSFSKNVVESPLTYDIPFNSLKYKMAVQTLVNSRKLKSYLKK